MFRRKTWYYKENNEEHLIFDEHYLDDLIRSSYLTPESKVRAEDTDQWVNIQQTELWDYFDDEIKRKVEDERRKKKKDESKRLVPFFSRHFDISSDKKFSRSNDPEDIVSESYEEDTDENMEKLEMMEKAMTLPEETAGVEKNRERPAKQEKKKKVKITISAKQTHDLYTRTVKLCIVLIAGISLAFAGFVMINRSVGSSTYETDKDKKASTFDISNKVASDRKSSKKAGNNKEKKDSGTKFYKALYTVEIYKKPNQNSSFMARTVKGEVVAIIKTKKDGDILWGQLETGNWIRINDDKYTYMEEVNSNE